MLPIDGVFCCRIDGVYQERFIAVRLWMRTLSTSMRPQQENRQRGSLLVSYMPLALRIGAEEKNRPVEVKSNSRQPCRTP